MQRTLTIDATKRLGKKIRVCGWVNVRRDHGKIIFIDLRDRWGIVQVVFTPNNKEMYRLAQTLRPEWVIEVSGMVKSRPRGMENPKIKTGSVEIGADRLIVHSNAETLPFRVDTDGYEIDEEKRMKYRYLDIRRRRLLKNLEIRQEIVAFARNYLQGKGFLEIETPILTKATPEGARDFVVPSRNQPGKFYALPQSPQQYKQLLMVAGIEKYFQISRCFRDEDPRGDRQAEFTQIDIEMSFASQEDIINLTEDMFIQLTEKHFPDKKISQVPFPRLTYKEAMEKYKTDRPDLRRKKDDSNELAFCWILDFPMFEYSQGKKKLTAAHHPFTMPQTEDIKEIKRHPEKILAFQYDLVLNGSEIGGGSLRSHKAEVLEAVFGALGHKKEDIRRKFGHLLNAFKYGVPPHGGIAPGLDRFIQVLLGEPNIREVIAFPKTGDNRGLMMDTPSEISREQLNELKLKIGAGKTKK